MLLEDDVLVLVEDVLVLVEDDLVVVEEILEVVVVEVLLDEKEDEIAELIGKELCVGSLEDGFPDKEILEELETLETLEELDETAVEELMPDDCRLSPDEMGSSVIPFHSEELLSPCVLCEPTSTMFTELPLSEVSDSAHPLNISAAAKAIAKNFFFIVFFPSYVLLSTFLFIVN